MNEKMTFPEMENVSNQIIMPGAVLSDQEIVKMCSEGKLITSALNDGQIQPNSVDLTLSGHFQTLHPNAWIFHHLAIDPREPMHFDDHEFSSKPLAIGEGSESTLVPTKNRWLRVEPGEFLNLATNEVFDLPNGICAVIKGRSSIGRMGLQLTNAGFIDAGFKGSCTLQAYSQCPYPIYLFEGMRICQVVFYRSGLSAAPYGTKANSKYVGGAAGMPTESRVHQDFEESK